MSVGLLWAVVNEMKRIPIRTDGNELNVYFHNETWWGGRGKLMIQSLRKDTPFEIEKRNWVKRNCLFPYTVKAELPHHGMTPIYFGELAAAASLMDKYREVQIEVSGMEKWDLEFIDSVLQDIWTWDGLPDNYRVIQEAFKEFTGPNGKPIPPAIRVMRHGFF